jgi:hypothetical protein
MDTNTMVALIIVIFAMPVLAAIIIILHVKGPAGPGLKLRAYNVKQPSQPSVYIQGAKARAGSIQATDETGQGVALNDVQAGKDIKAVNKQPTAGTPPKAKR